MKWTQLLFFFLAFQGILGQMGGGPAEDGGQTGEGPAGNSNDEIVGTRCTPRTEIWAVDQAATRKNNVNDPNNTTAVSGGVLYVYTPESIKSGTWDDVIDLYVEAREANCGVSKAPHMVRPNYANTRVVIPYTKGSWIHILSAETREIVGCLSLAGGEGGVWNTTGAMHDALVSNDDTFILIADMGGFLHKISSDFVNDRYKLIESLPLAPLKPSLNPANALPAPRPISFSQVTTGRLVYVTFSSGGVLVVDPGTVTQRMQVKKIYPISEVAQVGGLWSVSLPDGRVAINHGVVNPALDDYLHIFDGKAAESGVFDLPKSLVLPGVDSHGLDYCTTPEGKHYLINVVRETAELYVIDPDVPAIVTNSTLITPFLTDVMGDFLYLDRSNNGHTGYLTIRGKVPLTGGVSTNNARIPGILVFHVTPDCKTISWGATDFIRSLEDLTVEGADPHGLNLVKSSCPSLRSSASSKSKTDVNARSFGVGVGATIFVLFFVLLFLSFFRSSFQKKIEESSREEAVESKASVTETKRSSDSDPSSIPSEKEVELQALKADEQ